MVTFDILQREVMSNAILVLSTENLMEKTYRRNVVTVGPPISKLRDFSKSASIFTTCVAYRIELCRYHL